MPRFAERSSPSYQEGDVSSIGENSSQVFGVPQFNATEIGCQRAHHGMHETQPLGRSRIHAASSSCGKPASVASWRLTMVSGYAVLRVLLQAQRLDSGVGVTVL